MQRSAWVLALLFACGGDDGEGGVGSLDDEIAEFTPLICEASANCGQQDPAACERDVTMDLADAKAELDEAGEAACAACLHAKSIEIQKILAGEDGCDIRAADEAAVFAACDLDPATDYDGDGTLDNDDDEACAGYP